MMIFGVGMMFVIMGSANVFYITNYKILKSL